MHVDFIIVHIEGKEFSSTLVVVNSFRATDLYTSSRRATPGADELVY